MNKKLSAIFLVLCFGNILASAQTSKEKPAPTGLTLEITSLKDKPPVYTPIPRSPAIQKYAFGAYKLIPGFQTSAERLPVQAVEFIASLENDLVKVNIVVFTGRGNFEKKEDVAVYSLRENERAVIKELADFGVEPFEIHVVRVTPSVSNALPSVENKTTSLQVTAIEPNFSTLPSYKITILNTSNKAVSAFTTETMENGRIRLSGMAQHKYNENIIEPGATWFREMQIPLESKKSLDGEAPKPTNRQTYIISSVVFADGSYEGDASRAARFRAFTLGRKVKVKQIIVLLEEFETASTFNLNKFVEQAAKLETKVSDSEFDGLFKQFPSLSEREKTELREIVEDVAAFDIRKEFTTGTEKRLREIESDAARVIYIKALKGKYLEWLARLP